MESTWIELAKQSPSLVVFALMAWRGLVFLREERASRDTIDRERLQAIREINQECHDHADKLADQWRNLSEKNNAVIAENTRALGAVKAAIDSACQ